MNSEAKPTKHPKHHRSRHALQALIPIVILLAAATTESGAATATEVPRQYVVEVTATTSTAPPAIRLAWRALTDDSARSTFGPCSGIKVSRRLLGETGWSAPLASLEATATSYTDHSVTTGTAYEYRVTREWPSSLPSSIVASHGHIAAGIDLPAVHARGSVIVLVDSSLAPLAENEINRFLADLRGDGWNVIRRNVARSTPVPEVRALIKAEYAANADLRSLVILGAVPQPYSGWDPADGHWGDHEGAWPTDSFYADMDGVWTDTDVRTVKAAQQRNHNVPGDGKYDAVKNPGAVELETGRIDLREMPAFALPGESWTATEARLLRRYLDRNHQWRHRRFTVPDRAILFDGFSSYGNQSAFTAWENFSPLVNWTNAQLVTNLPSSYNMFPTNTTLPSARNPYLFALGAGFGTPTTAQFVVSTPNYLANTNRAVFTFMFGSYFGDWGYGNCLLKAPLVADGYGLATIWSDPGDWHVHSMGLGHTFGYAVKQSLNWFLPVGGKTCLGLLGDPTLRIHIVAPPAGLTVSGDDTGQFLSWTASPQAADPAFLGYHVYRAQDVNGPWLLLNATPVVETTFTDPVRPVSALYMVRAALRTTSPSGTYENLSQGIVAPAQGILRLGEATATPAFVTLPSSTTPATSTLGISATGAAGTSLTYAWSRLSGPGTVTLDSPSASSCRADFGSAGDHVLQVTVTDNLGNSARRTVTVSVAPAPYPVIYDSNGATVGSAPPPQTKQHDVPLQLASRGGLGRPGLVFDCWNTRADGTGTDFAEGQYYVGNAPLVLHAKWKVAPVWAWTGVDPSSTHWGRPGNWAGGLLPEFGNTADLLFVASGWNGTNPNSPVFDNRTLRSITFANLSDTRAPLVSVSTSNGATVGKTLTFDSLIGNPRVTMAEGNRRVVIGTVSTLATQQVGNIVLARDLEVTNNDGDHVIEFNRPVTGTGGLVKRGIGSLELNNIGTGAHSYAGTTTIEGGTLLVNGIKSGSGNIVVGGANATGTPGFGGGGSVAGDVTIAGADGGTPGTLAPGPAATPGTLTLANRNLILEPGAKLAMRLGTTSDRVNGVATLVLNGQQWNDFAFSVLTGFGPGTYVLVAANAVSGTLGTATSGTLGGLPATLGIDGNNDLVLTISSSGLQPLHMVTYDRNGATGGTVPDPQIKTPGVSLVMASNTGNLVKTGHRFSGWNTAANGTGTDYPPGTVHAAESGLALFAKWAPLPTYPVSYSANGATSGTPPPAQTKIDSLPLTLATNGGNLARPGFNFAGWNTAANGSGTDYGPGSEYTADAPLALYAKWLPVLFSRVWDGEASDASWGTTGNWDTNLLPPFGNAAEVIFASGTLRMNNFLGSARTIRNLTFNSAADSQVTIRLTTTAAGTVPANLTFDGGGYGATLTVDAGSTPAAAHTLGMDGGNIVLADRLLVAMHSTARQLVINRPIIQTGGPRSITLTGTGAGIVLGSANTFSGGVFINGGVVQVNNSNGLGTGPVTLNGTGAVLRQSAVNIANPVVVSDNGNRKTLAHANPNTATYTGTVTINESTPGHFSIDVLGNGNLILAGAIGGSGGFERTSSGTGTGVLRLAAANTHTGPTRATAGILQLGHPSALQNSPLDTGGTGTTDANAGTGTYAIGGLISGRNLADAVTSDTNITTLRINPQSGSVTYDNVISDLAPNMALTKTGAGTQILGGANTYTGPTFVGNGTLLVNGSLHERSAVSVAPGATLGGSGTISGTLAADGTIIPGIGSGTLSAGSTVLGNPSALVIEINDSAMPANDMLAVNGSLTINGGTLELAVTGSPAEQAYVLITFTGPPPTGRFSTVNNLPAGYGLVYDHNGNSVALVKQTAALATASLANGLSTTSLTGGFTMANTSLPEPNADSDGDGIPDGIELVFGSDPASATAAADMPELTRQGSALTYRFRRSEASKGHPVVIEESPDLLNWPVSHPVPDTDGTLGHVTVTGEEVVLTLPADGETNRFLRIRALMPSGR